MQGAWNKMIIKYREGDIQHFVDFPVFMKWTGNKVWKLNLPLHLQTYNEDSHLQY